MDKILKRIIKETAEELGYPEKQVALAIENQHDDIYRIIQEKGSHYKFILLKGFGSFSLRANMRRPFRSDTL